MKNKHRIKQGLSLLLAGGIALTNLGAALPAFAEDAAATPETASAATPETAEANVPTPNLSQITENLYNDLPDAPTGSYLGSMGLPVATGETKIGISAWVSDLYDGVDAHMDADALNADENTVTIGKTPGTDYAIVPLLAQVEYPADGAVSEIILPDGVELLSYLSTDYEPIPADEQEQTEILHQTYSEQSAAATGLYVKASADFTAQLVYTDSDGSSQSKAIHVQISEDAAPTQMYADTGDDSIAAYAAGPTPPYATGKITSIAKEGGTWQDVLAVFASYVSGAEDGAPVAYLDEENLDRLRTTLWDMNEVDHRIEAQSHDVKVPGEEGNTSTETITETVLVIELTHRSPEKMRDEYDFNARQNEYLSLLLAEDTAPLWGELLGGFSTGGGEVMTPGSDASLADGRLQWPLPVPGTITSPQGYRTDPITGEVSYHSGTDIAVPEGTPILAAADGTVTIANGLDSWGGSYGYHVKLDHGGGLITLYAHCSSICVTVGQQVKAGQVIAYVGHTGRAMGPHLHFEVHG